MELLAGVMTSRTATQADRGRHMVSKNPEGGTKGVVMENPKEVIREAAGTTSRVEGISRAEDIISKKAGMAATSKAEVISKKAGISKEDIRLADTNKEAQEDISRRKPEVIKETTNLIVESSHRSTVADPGRDPCPQEQRNAGTEKDRREKTSLLEATEVGTECPLRKKPLFRKLNALQCTRLRLREKT